MSVLLENQVLLRLLAADMLYWLDMLYQLDMLY
jgi:hypothetical protein